MVQGYAVAAAVVAAGGIAVMAVLAVPGGDDAFAQCRTSQVSGGPGAIGGPFALTDQTGRKVTDRDILIRPALVYFGYTFCPDVCPLDNARNAEAVDLLARGGHDVVPVFISIDPERDTPAVMADYVAAIHPGMIGLTGTQAEVKAASLAYKTYYKINDPTEEYYLVDHSTFTYLMLPETGFAEFYRRETTPEQMAASVGCFLTAAGDV